MHGTLLEEEVVILVAKVVVGADQRTVAGIRIVMGLQLMIFRITKILVLIILKGIQNHIGRLVKERFIEKKKKEN